MVSVDSGERRVSRRGFLKLGGTSLAGVALSGFAVSCGAASNSGDSGGAWQPEQPIEFIVHASAGGGTDLMARKVAEILEDEQIVEQPINVVNRTGGGGAVAYSYVREQQGNPHVIAAVTTSYLTTPIQGTSPVSYEDFNNYAILGEDIFLSVVSAESSYKELDDVIEAAKSDPGEVTFGGTQRGAMDHFIAQELEQAADVEFNYVPYDGDSDVNQDILGGRVDLTSTNPSQSGELIESGRLRAIVAFTEDPIPGFEDVPTAAELGYEDTILTQIRGAIGPPGLSAEQAEFWRNAMEEVATSEEWQTYAENNGIEPKSRIGDSVDKRMNSLSSQYTEYLEQLGLAEE